MVDLAYFFHRDQDVPQAEKHQRDRDIALASPGADDDPARLSLWLHAMRQQQGRGDQQPTHEIQQGLSTLLFVIGATLGVLTVGGWLSLNKLLAPNPIVESGINVIYFWSVTAGWQLLMLLVILASLALGDWANRVPGLGGLHRLLRWLPSLIPGLAESILNRLKPSQREVMRQVQTWLTQSQRYRRLTFWYPLLLSQRFAVGFNLGLIITFLFFSFATQPTFGWQSGQLNCARLEYVTQVIAAPWSWLVPDGRPSANDIRLTYHAPDASHAHLDCSPTLESIDPGWWPFLFASMLVYGLIPRVLTHVLASWQVNRTTQHVVLHHPDSRELLMRMQRPMIDTGSRSPTTPFSPPEVQSPSKVEVQKVSSGRGFVLKWAGIQLPDEEIRDLVRDQWGVETMALHEVGGLDVSRDATALQALNTSSDFDQVILLVEAWQPPVTDYRNFIVDLRQALGDDMMIWVLLYHRDTGGDIAAPRTSDLDQWRTTLERVDAWLRVKPMIEEPV